MFTDVSEPTEYGVNISHLLKGTSCRMRSLHRDSRQFFCSCRHREYKWFSTDAKHNILDLMFTLVFFFRLMCRRYWSVKCHGKLPMPYFLCLPENCLWWCIANMCYRDSSPSKPITCWWFGNVLMASSKSWVTILRSRTGIPAAKSCFVRLNTQALAASWTFRVAGWFFIPRTTS